MRAGPARAYFARPVPRAGAWSVSVTEEAAQAALLPPVAVPPTADQHQSETGEGYCHSGRRTLPPLGGGFGLLGPRRDFAFRAHASLPESIRIHQLVPCKQGKPCTIVLDNLQGVKYIAGFKRITPFSLS